MQVHVGVKHNVYKTGHFHIQAIYCTAPQLPEHGGPAPLRGPRDPGFASVSPPQWEEVKHEARSSATVLAKYRENTRESDFREALELASKLLDQKERSLGAERGEKDT